MGIRKKLLFALGVVLVAGGTGMVLSARNQDREWDNCYGVMKATYKQVTAAALGSKHTIVFTITIPDTGIWRQLRDRLGEPQLVIVRSDVLSNLGEYSASTPLEPVEIRAMVGDDEVLFTPCIAYLADEAALKWPHMGVAHTIPLGTSITVTVGIKGAQPPAWNLIACPYYPQDKAHNVYFDTMLNRYAGVSIVAIGCLIVGLVLGCEALRKLHQASPK